MDASVFIANKRVLWLWILSPLLIRLVAVAATYGLTAGYLAEFDEAKACAKAADELLPEVTANDWVLKRYEQSKTVPLNEKFYQLVADRNAEYGVNLNAKVEAVRTKNSTVGVYKMEVDGIVASVYQASAYFADLSVDPLFAMQRGSISLSFPRSKGTEDAAPPEVVVSAGFDRLAFFQDVKSDTKADVADEAKREAGGH